jgi:gliding motility-associated lipoprotein GldD
MRLSASAANPPFLHLFDKMRLVCKPKGLVLLGVLGCLLVGCAPTPYPRPFGYHRIDFPERAYQQYDAPGCPFTFEYPRYAEVLPRTRTDSCSVTLYFPQFRAYWHLTDRDFARDGAGRNKSFEDYRKVVYKHSQKATNILETPFDWPAGQGVFFELWGEVPTSAQLFVTDSTDRALMASFYFRTASKNDSLAPVIDFLKADMLHLAETLRFE